MIRGFGARGNLAVENLRNHIEALEEKIADNPNPGVSTEVYRNCIVSAEKHIKEIENEADPVRPGRGHYALIRSEWCVVCETKRMTPCSNLFCPRKSGSLLPENLDEQN